MPEVLDALSSKYSQQPVSWMTLTFQQFDDVSLMAAQGINHDDGFPPGCSTDQGRTPRAPALNRTALGIVDHVLNFIDAQAVAGDVLGISSRIVLAISFDEIEVHRMISRPDSSASIC